MHPHVEIMHAYWDVSKLLKLQMSGRVSRRMFICSFSVDIAFLLVYPLLFLSWSSSRKYICKENYGKNPLSCISVIGFQIGRRHQLFSKGTWLHPKCAVHLLLWWKGHQISVHSSNFFSPKLVGYSSSPSCLEWGHWAADNILSP